MAGNNIHFETDHGQKVFEENKTDNKRKNRKLYKVVRAYENRTKRGQELGKDFSKNDLFLDAQKTSVASASAPNFGQTAYDIMGKEALPSHFEMTMNSFSRMWRNLPEEIEATGSLLAGDSKRASKFYEDMQKDTKQFLANNPQFAAWQIASEETGVFENFGRRTASMLGSLAGFFSTKAPQAAVSLLGGPAGLASTLGTVGTGLSSMMMKNEVSSDVYQRSKQHLKKQKINEAAREVYGRIPDKFQKYDSEKKRFTAMAKDGKIKKEYQKIMSDPTVDMEIKREAANRANIASAVYAAPAYAIEIMQVSNFLPESVTSNLFNKTASKIGEKIVNKGTNYFTNMLKSGTSNAVEELSQAVLGEAITETAAEDKNGFKSLVNAFSKSQVWKEAIPALGMGPLGFAGGTSSGQSTMNKNTQRLINKYTQAVSTLELENDRGNISDTELEKKKEAARNRLELDLKEIYDESLKEELNTNQGLVSVSDDLIKIVEDSEENTEQRISNYLEERNLDSDIASNIIDVVEGQNNLDEEARIKKVAQIYSNYQARNTEDIEQSLKEKDKNGKFYSEDSQTKILQEDAVTSLLQQQIEQFSSEQENIQAKRKELWKKITNRATKEAGARQTFGTIYDEDGNVKIYNDGELQSLDNVDDEIAAAHMERMDRLNQTKEMGRTAYNDEGKEIGQVVGIGQEKIGFSRGDQKVLLRNEEGNIIKRDIDNTNINPTNAEAYNQASKQFQTEIDKAINVSISELESNDITYEQNPDEYRQDLREKISNKVQEVKNNYKNNETEFNENIEKAITQHAFNTIDNKIEKTIQKRANTYSEMQNRSNPELSSGMQIGSNLKVEIDDNNNKRLINTQTGEVEELDNDVNNIQDIDNEIINEIDTKNKAERQFQNQWIEDQEQNKYVKKTNYGQATIQKTEDNNFELSFDLSNVESDRTWLLSDLQTAKQEANKGLGLTENLNPTETDETRLESNQANLANVKGIGSQKLEKLQQNDIETVNDLAQLDDNQIQRIVESTDGLGKKGLRNFKNEAQKERLKQKYRSLNDQELLNMRSQVDGAELEALSELADERDIGYQRQSSEDFIQENQELANAITKRLQQNFPQVDAQQVQAGVEITDDEGNLVFGEAIGDVVRWAHYGRLDTPPHEYAHWYVNIMQNDPTVQKAINHFGSKHELIYWMGQNYVDKVRNDSLTERGKRFIRRAWLRIKKLFTQISPREATLLVGENFYRGQITENYATRVNNNEESAYQKTEQDPPDSIQEIEETADEQSNEVEREDNFTPGSIIDNNESSNETIISRVFGEVVKPADLNEIKNRARVESRDIWLQNAKTILGIDKQLNNNEKQNAFALFTRLQPENEVTVNQRFNKGRGKFGNNDRIYLSYHNENLGTIQNNYELREVSKGTQKYIHPVNENQLAKSEVKTPFERIVSKDIINGINTNTKVAYLRKADIIEKDSEGNLQQSERQFQDFVSQLGEYNSELNRFARENNMVPLGTRADSKKIIFLTIPQETVEYAKKKAKEEDISISRAKADVFRQWRTKLFRQIMPTFDKKNNNKEYADFFKRLKLLFTPSVLPLDKYNTNTVANSNESIKTVYYKTDKTKIVYGDNNEISIEESMATDANKDIQEKLRQAGITDANEFINNVNDGATFISEKHMDNIVPRTGGIEGKKTLKTLWYHADSNGNMALSKHMEMTGEEGIKFYDTERDEVFAKFVREDDKVQLKYKVGENEWQDADAISSEDEVKMSNGEFQHQQSQVKNIPAHARNTILIPTKKSKNHSSFSMQGMNYENSPEIFNAVNKYLKSLNRARDIENIADNIGDPQAFKDYLDKYIPTIKEKYDYDGAWLDINATVHRGMKGAVNRGLYSALKKYLTLRSDGTMPVMRPDMKNEVAPNELHVGMNNDYITNEILRRFFLSGEYADIEIHKEMTEELRNKVNDWLQDNPQKILAARNPIPQETGHGTYKVTKILPKNLGDTVKMNIFDVFNRMQGDHDGDKLYLSFLKNGDNGQEVIEKINQRQQENSFIRKFNKPNNLDEVNDLLKSSETKSDDILKYTTGLAQLSNEFISGANGISQIASLESVVGYLNHINGTIKFANKATEEQYARPSKEVTITAKNWNDQINYEDLNDQEKKIYEQAESGNLNISFNTVEDYLKFYLQAAVDNSKYNLLSKLDYRKKHLINVVMDNNISDIRSEIEQNQDNDTMSNFDFVNDRMITYLNSVIRAPFGLKGGAIMGESYDLNTILNLAENHFDNIEGNEQDLTPMIDELYDSPILEIDNMEMTLERDEGKQHPIEAPLEKIYETFVSRRKKIDNAYFEDNGINLTQEENNLVHKQALKGEGNEYGYGYISIRQKWVKDKFQPVGAKQYLERVLSATTDNEYSDRFNKIAIHSNDNVDTPPANMVRAYEEIYERSTNTIDFAEQKRQAANYVQKMMTWMIAANLQDQESVSSYSSKMQTLHQKGSKLFGQLDEMAQVYATYMMLDESVANVFKAKKHMGDNSYKNFRKSAFSSYNDRKYNTLPPRSMMHDEILNSFLEEYNRIYNENSRDKYLRNTESIEDMQELNEETLGEMRENLRNNAMKQQTLKQKLVDLIQC